MFEQHAHFCSLCAAGTHDHSIELCCPLPWRPVSPVQARLKKRKSHITNHCDPEACKEIQSILFDFEDGEDRRLSFDSPVRPSTPSRLSEKSGSIDNKKKPPLGDSHSGRSNTVTSSPVLIPVRSHNPLPKNSPFVNKKTDIRAEFGLLSPSPTPLEEVDDFTGRLARINPPAANQNLANSPTDDEVFPVFDVQF